MAKRVVKKAKKKPVAARLKKKPVAATRKATRAIGKAKRKTDSKGVLEKMECQPDMGSIRRMKKGDARVFLMTGTVSLRKATSAATHLNKKHHGAYTVMPVLLVEPREGTSIKAVLVVCDRESIE